MSIPSRLQVLSSKAPDDRNPNVGPKVLPPGVTKLKAWNLALLRPNLWTYGVESELMYELRFRGKDQAIEVTMNDENSGCRVHICDVRKFGAEVSGADLKVFGLGKAFLQLKIAWLTAAPASLKYGIKESKREVDEGIKSPH
jgi:hypothetical protein